MVRFQGSFEHTLDSKSRLTVPSEFRAALSDGVVLARPVHGQPCVTVWRTEEYEEFASSAIGGMPALSQRRSDLERFFYGKSVRTRLDSAGRVMIPPGLAGECSIDRDVLVIGAGSRLELWNSDVWNEHQPALNAALEEATALADAA